MVLRPEKLISPEAGCLGRGYYEMAKRYYMKGITRFEGVLLAALVVVAALAGYAWLKAVATPGPPVQRAPQTITIVDSAGRYVTAPWPVKRVAALTSASAMTLVALGARDAIVGITDYAAGAPWAPNVTSVGTCFKPNIEAIVSVKPDIVITYARWPKPEDLEDKLEPFGIKVVRLDFYKIETLFAETRLLGLLLNRTREAEDLISYWQGVYDEIVSRVSGLEPENKTRVYFEGYHDYKAAGPGSGWDELLRLAGGLNIYADALVTYPKVSAEDVVARNPDVIIKAVSKTKFNPYGATDDAPLREIWESIISRPGWDQITAVKNGRVYLICAGLLHDSFGLVAELAYIAKLLYPDLFADLNPSEVHRHFIEDNLGIPYVGIWIYPAE